MLSLKRQRERTGCDIRSECKAKSNRRFYNRLLKDDFDVMVIKLDANKRDYKMSKAKLK
jgi:hypothetical protein